MRWIYIGPWPSVFLVLLGGGGRVGCNSAKISPLSLCLSHLTTRPGRISPIATPPSTPPPPPNQRYQAPYATRMKEWNSLFSSLLLLISRQPLSLSLSAKDEKKNNNIETDTSPPVYFNFLLCAGHKKRMGFGVCVCVRAGAFFLSFVTPTTDRILLLFRIATNTRAFYTHTHKQTWPGLREASWKWFNAMQSHLHN